MIVMQRNKAEKQHQCETGCVAKEYNFTEIQIPLL